MGKVYKKLLTRCFDCPMRNTYALENSGVFDARCELMSGRNGNFKYIHDEDCVNRDMFGYLIDLNKFPKWCPLEDEEKL